MLKLFSAKIARIISYYHGIHGVHWSIIEERAQLPESASLRINELTVDFCPINDSPIVKMTLDIKSLYFKPNLVIMLRAPGIGPCIAYWCSQLKTKEGQPPLRTTARRRSSTIYASVAGRVGLRYIVQYNVNIAELCNVHSRVIILYPFASGWPAMERPRRNNIFI